MSKNDPVIRKGSGPPVTVGPSHVVGVRLHRPALAALDGYRTILGPGMTRGGAAKQIIERTLDSIRRGDKTD